MPSVVATWNGTCRDRQAQGQLVAHLDEIAAFSQACRGLPVNRIDRTITGNILLAPDLSRSADPKIAADHVGRISRLQLYGIAVRPLFRFDRTSSEGSFDFTFVRASDHPSLDGVLVQLVEDGGLQDEDQRSLRGAAVRLRTPRIYLRYQFESWADKLMNWIRTYFVEDLRYWRWNPDRGHDGAAFAPHDLAKREEARRRLKEAYMDEATSDEFLADLAGMRKAARKAHDLPWDWLAEQATSCSQTAHLSVAARAAIPSVRWRALRIAAAVAVLKAGRGTDLDYLSFHFEGAMFALSSRLRWSGLSIDVDIAPPIAPRKIVLART
jgi:hypothetical protein